MGMQIAFENCFEENLFLCVTIALLSAVGGGLLRDVLTETQPYIFKKHIYALASIVGALLYYACEVLVGIQVLSAVVGIVFIIGIRILATKYRWSLPKIQFDETKKAPALIASMTKNEQADLTQKEVVNEPSNEKKAS
jgi:uncharacterized membrane protein YeiH